MAINTAPTFKPGQKLTPEQIKQMMALAQNPQRSGSMDGKFGAQIVFDPRQVQRGTSVGADAETMADPSGAGRHLIIQPRNVSSMGGSDVSDVWDGDGNYLGTSSGATDLRGLANLVATSVGSYYAQGLMTGGEGGGLSGLDAAALDMGAGATNVGGGLSGLDLAAIDAGAGATNVGNGLSGLDTAMIDAGAGATNVADGLSGLDAAALDSGAGATNVGTELSGLDTAALDAGAGPTNVGTPTTTPGSPPTTTPPTTTPPPGTTPPPASTLTPGAVKTGVDLLKAGTVVAGAIAGGDALSDPVDTSKWDQLFANMLSEQSLASQRGRDLWADYTTTFKPAQQKFVDTAMNFDTAPRRESAAQDASGRVAASYDEQRMSAQREMERAGVDPSTIYALGVSSRLNQAKDEAAAENDARSDVEKTGLNLLKGVVDQGNQVVNQSTQQSNIVTGTGNSASGILNSQANAQNQNTQNRNGMISDLLTTAGTLYGMSSSKKVKDRGGKVDGLAAVKAIEKSPAEHWRYKPGQGDGSTQQRMGPMAEDLKKAAPQVSDGKKVDMIALVGLQHAAIGGLSKRLAGIEKKLGGLADARRKAA